ncbi:MAG: thiamine-phosphate kinase [Negativicutes bacterium]|jgi:thiamine-monophosphate kinase
MSTRQQLVSEIGEFGLIDRVNTDMIADGLHVVKGIGDDCAVVRTADENSFQLFTTDMLVESVHFTTLMKDEDVGYKAIICSVSDIAAMGGTPQNCLISLGIPGTLEVDRIERLYLGMKQACRQYAINIIGGDTVRSPKEIIINVAMTGIVNSNKIVYRSGAGVGDLVLVSGSLGLSSIGLRLLQKNIIPTPDSEAFFIKHCRPQARVELGQKLAEHGATAMNDISDGLASELNEIAVSSLAGILIDEQLIPVAKISLAIQSLLDKSPTQYALYGGEDYELVFTMSRANYTLLDQTTRAAITVIGEVTDKFSGVRMQTDAGQIIELKSRGYNHFCD